MLYNHLILCCPLLHLPSMFPSIVVFSNESTLCVSWPKYQSFNFRVSPSSEYSGLISFRIDWFDLLAVQGTLKSLLQHCSLTASVLWHSAFFIVQFSHPYLTTGKTIVLTIQTFVGKVMCLLFFFFFVICCLSCHSFSSKEQVSFNFMAAVTIHNDFGAQENNICHCIHFFHLKWNDGIICHDLCFLFCFVFLILSFRKLFHFPLSPTSTDSLVSLHLLPLEWLTFAYLRLLIFLPAILIPACASFSLAFHMMYSAFKLKKQTKIHSIDLLLSQFGTSLLFHVWFLLLLFDLHTDFPGGRWGGLYSYLLENFTQFAVIHTKA